MFFASLNHMPTMYSSVIHMPISWIYFIKHKSVSFWSEGCRVRHKFKGRGFTGIHQMEAEDAKYSHFMIALSKSIQNCFKLDPVTLFHWTHQHLFTEAQAEIKRKHKKKSPSLRHLDKIQTFFISFLNFRGNSPSYPGQTQLSS